MDTADSLNDVTSHPETPRKDSLCVILVAFVLLSFLVIGFLLWKLLENDSKEVAPDIQSEMATPAPSEALQEVFDDVSEQSTELGQRSLDEMYAARHGLVTGRSDFRRVDYPFNYGLSPYLWEMCDTGDYNASYFQEIRDAVMSDVPTHYPSGEPRSDADIRGILERTKESIDEHCRRTDFRAPYRLYYFQGNKFPGITRAAYRVNLESGEVLVLNNHPSSLWDVPFMSHHGITYVSDDVPRANIYTYDAVTDTLVGLQYTQPDGVRLTETEMGSWGEIYATDFENNTYYFRIFYVCVEETDSGRCADRHYFKSRPYFAQVVIE